MSILTSLIKIKNVFDKRLNTFTWEADVIEITLSRDWILQSPLPLTRITSVSLCVSCNAELISLALVEIEIKQHVSSTELLLRLQMCIESYSLLTGFCYDQPMGPQLLLPKVLIASQQNCDKGFRDRTPRTENKSFRDGLWPHFSKKNKTVNYNLCRPLLLLYFFGNNNHLLNT